MDNLIIQPKPVSALAVSSMVIGIIGVFIGLCSFGIPSFVAIILGHLAIQQDVKKFGRPGYGMAITGLITGYIVAIPWFVFGIMVGIGGFVQMVQSW